MLWNAQILIEQCICAIFLAVFYFYLLVSKIQLLQKEIKAKKSPYCPAFAWLVYQQRILEMLDMSLLILHCPLALVQSKVDSLMSSFRNCVTSAMLCKVALCRLTDNTKCCIYIGIKLCSVTSALHLRL